MNARMMEKDSDGDDAEEDTPEWCDGEATVTSCSLIGTTLNTAQVSIKTSTLQRSSPIIAYASI